MRPFRWFGLVLAVCLLVLSGCGGGGGGSSTPAAAAELSLGAASGVISGTPGAITVRATFTGSVATLGSDVTGWSAPLSDLAVKHQVDAATNRYCYGALSISFGGGVAGLGDIVGPGASYRYPYANGIIGTWAYDSVANHLYAPTSCNDIMGYCSPNWVSDYNYRKVLDNRNAAGGFLVASPCPACWCGTPPPGR